MKSNLPSEKAKTLLHAYIAKGPGPGKSKIKQGLSSSGFQMVLILAVFDDRSAKWVYEFLIEEGELASQVSSKKEANQIRKISGWISKTRTGIMKLPPLCRGRIQPPDMAVARQRWDLLNPRPSEEELLSGDWKGIPADYSDLNLTCLGKNEKPLAKSADPTSGAAVEAQALHGAKTAESTNLAGASEFHEQPRSPSTPEEINKTENSTTEDAGSITVRLKSDLIDFSKAPTHERLPDGGRDSSAFEKEIRKIFNRRAPFLDGAHAAIIVEMPDPLMRNQAFHDLEKVLPRDDLDFYMTRRADLAVILLNEDQPGASNWQSALQKAKIAFQKAALVDTPP